MEKIRLSNNQLKIIAMLAMLSDHVGKALLPRLTILQIIGRIAFPIFAYMIAEGCSHTRNRGGYLSRMLGLALLCQAAYSFATGSLYLNILITFSLSVITIFCTDNARFKKTVSSFVLLFFELLVVIFICAVLPRLLTARDFMVDYGLAGTLLPVAVYLMPNKKSKLVCTALMLIIIGFTADTIQFFSLIAIPLLMLYSGERGRHDMKLLFYIFYPAHLLVIYLILFLIDR